MRPVEQTSTSSAAQPRWAATRAHIRSASASPVAPVAALAQPLLRTTAAARPEVAARWARLTFTGPAVALLDVNTAAATTGRPSSVATRDRSGSPLALIPQATPAATNPSGEVTPLMTLGHGYTPTGDRPAVSSRPRTMLAHCTACPDAPLTRLSMAARTTTQPVRGS